MKKYNLLDLKNTLIYSVWFGSLTGLVEGILLWTSNHMGWLTGRFQNFGSNIESVWISSVFNLSLFILIGFIIFVLGKLFPVARANKLIALLFFTLMVFDWVNIFLNTRARIFAVGILTLGIAVQYYWWLEKHQEKFHHAVLRSYRLLVSLVALSFFYVQGMYWISERQALKQLSAASPDSPNVLVVVVDTLRADHLSSYGYDRETSKYFDELSQQGVLFENAYSTSSWTLPAHASILTGLYPFEHGATSSPLDETHPVLGEKLKELGYTTAAFSANATVFNKRNGFGRGFIHFDDHFQTIGDMVKNTVYGRMFEYYVMNKILNYKDEMGRIRASDVNQSVFNWVDSVQAQPFFIFINYYDVHSPYIPPQPFRNQFSEIDNPGGLINGYWSSDGLYVNLSSEQMQSEIDAYDGSIAYVDYSVRKLMEGLGQRDMLNNTIVVIVSDHGELFGEHGLRAHSNSLYKEVIQVPLIMYWPGYIPGGIKISQPVSIASIPGTVMQLVNDVDKNVFFQPSLVSLWDDSVDPSTFPLPLAEVDKLGYVPQQALTAHGAMKSVVSSDWQYITHELYGEELFDLANDPKENKNLAGSDDHTDNILNYFRDYLTGLLSNHKK